MSKIDYDLSKELLIYEILKKSIKELKEYYKSHPDSIIVDECTIIPYLEQQIDCLKSINKYKMSLLNHFLYVLKRNASIYELHRLDGTLKSRLRKIFYTLALGTIITTNYSSSTKEVKPFITEEQREAINELPNTIDRITDEIEKHLKEKERVLEVSKIEPKITIEDIKEIAKSVKISECESYINEYSYYFNFDAAKVLDIARTLTSNFSTEIAITIGSKEVVSNSPETMAMFLVWDLYKNSSDYYLTREELTVTDEISHLEYDNDGNIILRNGLIFSQFIGKASDIIDGDRCFNLAVSNYETEYQTNS